jgi:hypothetical protein
MLGGVSTAGDELFCTEQDGVVPSLEFTEAARSRDAKIAMWVHFAIESRQEGQVWGDRKPVPDRDRIHRGSFGIIVRRVG